MWPCSSSTTRWSTGCATTGWPRRSCSPRPAGPPPGTTSGSCSPTSCPGWPGPSWPPSCWPAGPGTTAPTRARPGSRSSSPTPPTATGTARSATVTRSTATPSRCRSSPTCSASARSRRPWWSTGRTCSTCPGRPPAQRAKRIDGRLAASLIQLPTAISGVEGGDDYGSLAVRDLQRGQGVGLPSGEAVARRLGVEPLTPERGRPRPGGLAAGDAALVLPAQGGRAPRRGRAPWPGRRPPGRRGPGRHRRRRRRVVPGRRPRLAPHPAGRPARPVRSGRPAGLHHRGGGSGRLSRAGRLGAFPEPWRSRRPSPVLPRRGPGWSSGGSGGPGDRRGGPPVHRARAR